MAQERTVYNALASWENYAYKYGKSEALFNLKYNFHLTDEELAWILKKLVKKGLVDENDFEWNIRYLSLEDQFPDKDQYFPEEGFDVDKYVKDWSRLYESLESDIQTLIDKFEGYYRVEETADYGSSYILPNGKFLNLYPATHGVFENELDEYNVSFPYLKQSIQVNNGKNDTDPVYPYASLPMRNITNAQYRSLLLWIDDVDHEYEPGVEITIDHSSKTYRFKDYTPDDIIKKIKRYYASGTLYEARLKEEGSKDDWYFDWGTESVQGSDIFDRNRGESSYAREMIKLAKTGGTNERGLGAQIVEMTPREYLEACAKGFNSTYSSQIAQIEYDKTTLSRLQQVLTKYKKKFPITYLNVGSGWDRQEVHRGEFEQEGRHRMYVAGKMFGWDTKFPVLQIYEKDSEKADRYWKRRAEEKLQSVLWTAIQKAQSYHYLDIPELKEQVEWYLDRHFDGKSYSFSIEDIGNDQLLFTLNGVASKHYKDEFDFDRVPSVSEDDFDDLSDEEVAQLEKELGFKI